MSNPRPPVSWTACPYCGAKAHQVCRPKGWPAHDHDRRYYPMGRYHADRIKAARAPAVEVDLP